ncbi:MAG: CoA-substrate-specific enzyme activase [Firmicutes bacterium]|nr:CoA-substrate-specific enzyme activase [Bacillota bacterium]
MRATGICLGASRISLAVIEQKTSGLELIAMDSRSHDGDIVTVLDAMLANLCDTQTGLVAVTGRKFRRLVKLPSLPEAEAVEIAYEKLKDKYPGYNGIVSAGGENFMAYQLNGLGQIINVITGNKCASGTGEFFLQQLKRMNLSIEEALDAAEAEANDAYSVAGRCSVFCKSDCTHALNKGAAKGKVVAGLCRMMAVKIIELLQRCPANKFLLIGGTAKNKVMVDYIQEHTQEDKIIETADEAEFFEAFGAAVWALEHGVRPELLSGKGLVADQTEEGAFTFLPAISQAADKVTFKTVAKDTAREGDRCLVGLDVGSTTTKAVVMRIHDNAILGSIYLRTNGDPVGAARQCYQHLLEQVGQLPAIEGLGVTGSGRQIAGLHADTDGVINEIIAHATAAVFFDPQVDTIFEIGGQDAKYTYITNGVPSDYAMNEACSAGTGSFLEEAAKESMGIDTLDIADIALNSNRPPNFTDQCAAFIGSDIKTAIQEGIPREDIVGGLVYSICQNYANRVKGSRVIGKKIFMQGGVCYNKAVPMAMAALIGKEIIVPPEPGLMGAYGVALAVKQKIELGLLAVKRFNLKELAQREVVYAAPFVCGGGKENCDRKCSISMIEINGAKYPFGGACNKYVNVRRKVDFDLASLDLVRLREHLVFEKYAKRQGSERQGGKKIGILKSLLVNSLYPLYYNFFTELGLQVVLSDVSDDAGRDRRGAAFCYPVELAHGFMQNLLKLNPDYIFLPNVIGMQVENGIDTSVTCPLVQGEPYYLRSAFEELNDIQVLSPILDFSQGYDSITGEFIKIGRMLGYTRSASQQAFQIAVDRQRALGCEMKELGRKVVQELEADPDRQAIVLLGRPYNALTRDVNIGIPGKFASRGSLIIPWDFLSFEMEEPFERMFWSMGQMLMKVARMVAKHPQLFATYITNFSCGPDSFLLSYFRDTMGQKPSLTLELDSHTADAGVDTRIEAFLDVIAGYIELRKHVAAGVTIPQTDTLRSEMRNGKVWLVDAKGKYYDLRDDRVVVKVPSMGNIGSRLVAASMRHIGINATHLDPPTEEELLTGRANSSCKECLPFALVAGGILNDAVKQDPGKLLVYFFADSSGPCRFGQYHVQVRNLLVKNNLDNVTVLPLTSDNGYSGMGIPFQLRAWQSLILTEVLDDIYGALLVLAQDKAAAMQVFEESLRRIEQAIVGESWKGLKRVLRQEARVLAAIPRKEELDQAVKVALIGEIYVRTDALSRQFLVERLANKGIISKVAPITEFVYFCDYLLQKSLYHVKSSAAERLSSMVKVFFKQHYERQIKEIMAESKLYDMHMLDIPQLVANSRRLIAPEFTAGDTVLTVGAALTEMVDEVSGVLSIGPFGCMPCRVSEAILTQTIDTEKPRVAHDKSLVDEVMKKYPALPFLSIESDGNPFPQVIEAKLEIFIMQVKRIHQAIMEARAKGKNKA